MKISYNWLQSYFTKKLPKPKGLAEFLTMRSFEAESVEKKEKDYVFDVSILPNRAHDCLSHLGVAREISAILELKIAGNSSSSITVKMGNDSRRQNSRFSVDVKEPELCWRYIGRIIEGAKVKQSPKWLRDRLEAIGQKSINNIVDATNYAMFEFGQPLHVFDMDKVDGGIIVRKAKKGEKIITLDNQEFELDKDALVIADNKDALAIAGIKGGKKAEIDEKTTNIILEAANFEPISIRRTSRKIGLKTESSLRFENEITPELAEGAMDRATEIILQSAKGKAGAKIDFYPKRPNGYKIGLHPKDVARLLGVEISEKEIMSILNRLGFNIKKINPLKNVLKLAKSLVGKPYKYGASVTFDAPDCFDCSSFTSYVFAHSGAQIPRMTVDQFFFGKPIDEKELRPGDLVFSSSGNGKIHYESKEFMNGQKIKEGVDHVGLYLGDEKIIHAAKAKGKVVIDELKKSSASDGKNPRGFRRIITEDDDLLVVTVPHERLDVRRKEDLIEEVARIYGYEKIPAKLPEETLLPPKRNDNFFYAEIIKNILVGAGFSEVYNYSFANKGDIELANPMAKDKGYLRTNLIDGLNFSIGENSRYFKAIKIFEIGKIFYDEVETISLAGAMSGVDFYAVKGVVEALLNNLGITDYYFRNSSDKAADIRVGNTSVGHIDNNGFEINFEMLVRMATEEVEYRPISRYPASKRDIAVFVPVETRMVEVEDAINNAGGELLIDVDLFDIYENEERKSLAFHLIFQSHDKTLSEKEINDLMNKIMEVIDANVDWEVRR